MKINNFNKIIFEWRNFNELNMIPYFSIIDTEIVHSIDKATYLHIITFKNDVQLVLKPIPDSLHWYYYVRPILSDNSFEPQLPTGTIHSDDIKGIYKFVRWIDENFNKWCIKVQKQQPVDMY